MASIGIRPEHITLVPSGGQLSGTISHVEHLGSDTNVFVSCENAGLISVRLFGEHEYEIDTIQSLHLDPERMFKFDSDGLRIR